MHRPYSVASSLIAILLLAGLSACGLALDEDARLERAREAYAANDFASAIVDLKALLQENGDNIDARLLLGESLFRTGDVLGSEKEFETAVELLRAATESNEPGVSPRPNAADELVDTTGKLAALQLGIRQFEPALANAEFVLEANPNNLGVYVIASQSAYYIGDTAKSRTYAARLLERSPNHPMAHALLGFVDAREGAYTEAEAHFSVALELDPNNAAARLTLTQLQLAMAKPEAAVATFAPLLVATPTDERLLQIFDLMQLGGAEARTSVDVLARGIETNNAQSPVPGLLRGRSLFQASEYLAAADQFQAAMAKGGGRYAVVGYYLAQRAAGNQAVARQALEQWLDANAGDQASGFLLAADYQAAGDNDRARAVYERVLGTAEADSPVILNNLAWLYGEINDPRAIETARQAHQAAPDNGAISDTLGWLLVKAGEYEEGIQLLRLAAEQAPDVDEIRYHLATALAEAGDLGDAQRQIERILRGPAAPGSSPQAEANPPR